jgi:hypothetical protein
MTPESPEIPQTRSWRDIAQPVRPRAMSRGGRWRLTLAVARTLVTGAVIGGVAWGAWTIAGAVSGDARAVPAAAKAVPLRAPELKTDRDGVLDAAWLARALALPKGVSLMELDLGRLRARVLADRQVETAVLTRHPPDRLVVKITERSPIARMRVDLADGGQRDVLIARDGAGFLGTGYDPAGLATLPWIAGAPLARDGLGFRVGGDVEPLARLLADAQFAAPHLYREWHSVSLAHLAADRELEVTMKSGLVVVFSAHGGFFLQLAKLDYVADRLARAPGVNPPRIDLSLGRDVPVTSEPVVPAQVRLRRGAPATPALFSVFSSSQPPLTREF